LENHRDVAVFGGHVGNVLAIDDKFAFGDILEAGNHTQSCAFATAGWAYQNDKLAILYIQIEIEYRLDVVVVDFVQVL
jgi:hypothetical protein